MRKVLGWAVVGAVGGGAILWLLEPYKDRFPDDWEAVFDLVWAPMPLPRFVVAIAVLAIGYLLFAYWSGEAENTTPEAATPRPQAKPKALAHGSAKLEPTLDALSDQKTDRMSLTDDEETVLSSLTTFANSVGADQLRQSSGLNETRFENAVGNLRSRLFIDDVPLNEGRSIAFKQVGRRYAIKHGLGQS